MPLLAVPAWSCPILLRFETRRSVLTARPRRMFPPTNLSKSSESSQTPLHPNVTQATPPPRSYVSEDLKREEPDPNETHQTVDGGHHHDRRDSGRPNRR